MNWNKAAETLEACTTLIDSPDVGAKSLPVLLTKRAWAARRLDDFEAAMADINRALELQPDTPLIWVNRAFIHDAQDNWAAADEDFERALLLAPENLSTIMDRAGILTRRGDDSGALRDYKLAFEIDPNSKRAALGIIHTLEKMGDYDAAIERRMAATKQWPEDANILYSLGSLQYSTENYQAALVSFEAAARLNPEHELNLFFLGATNLRLGNVALGKSYIEQHAAQLAWSMVNEGSLFRRAIGLMSIVIPLAGKSELLFQGVSYAIIDQPELSREAFQRYLDSGGSNAMRIMQGLLANYYECAGAGCDEGYEAALSRYLDAVGNTFLLDTY